MLLPLVDEAVRRDVLVRHRRRRRLSLERETHTTRGGRRAPRRETLHHISLSLSLSTQLADAEERGDLGAADTLRRAKSKRRHTHPRPFSLPLSLSLSLSPEVVVADVTREGGVKQPAFARDCRPPRDGRGQCRLAERRLVHGGRGARAQGGPRRRHRRRDAGPGLLRPLPRRREKKPRPPQRKTKMESLFLSSKRTERASTNDQSIDRIH